MTEIVFFPSAGSYPGFPGTHGPGLYEVNFEARTITPVPSIGNIVESTIEPATPALPEPEPLQGTEQDAATAQELIQEVIPDPMLAQDQPTA